jgi:hypothetical protein
MDLKEIRSSKLAQPVTCVVFTCKLPGFNLGSDPIYPQGVVVFLHLSRHMLRQYLKLDDHHFVRHSFQFIIHYHAVIRHY